MGRTRRRNQGQDREGIPREFAKAKVAAAGSGATRQQQTSPSQRMVIRSVVVSVTWLEILDGAFLRFQAVESSENGFTEDIPSTGTMAVILRSAAPLAV